MGMSASLIGVRHFQTIRHCSVDVARGLLLLFGIGAGPFHEWRVVAALRGPDNFASTNDPCITRAESYLFQTPL